MKNEKSKKDPVEKKNDAGGIGGKTITSLDLVECINFFREKEGNRTELLHKSMMGIIRDEFSDEINEQKILPVSYKDKKGEERPMFVLSYSQAKQVLVRESKLVRIRDHIRQTGKGKL